MYRCYDNPPPLSSRIIRDYVSHLCRALGRLLRKGSGKGFTARLEFRHDVFRHLFGDSLTLKKQDFDTRYFCKGWDQSFRVFKKRVSGVVIVFPIEVELYIAWMGGGRFYFDEDDQEFKRKKSCPIEKIKLSVTKRNVSRHIGNNK